MPNEEFIATYKVHPIRYMQTTYLDEFTQIFNEDNEEDIIKKLEMYQKLGFNEYVYIPFCLGIISKFPYYDKVINDPTLPAYISDFLSFKQELKLLEIKCK